MVVLPRQEQDRWILGPILDVVIWRIGIQCFELLRIFHRAELRYIERPIGIEFNPQHVVNSDLRNYCSEEVGALSKHCAHEQSTVAAAHNRQMFGRSVTGS